MRQSQPLFWGFRLHAIFSDGTPRALALTSPKADERDVALKLLERCKRHGDEKLLGDKGYAGRRFAQAVMSDNAKCYAVSHAFRDTLRDLSLIHI